jgi:predicted dehydrogenase
MSAQVRVGVLGTGWMAGRMARALRVVDGVRLQAVASRSPARAQAFAHAHEVPTAHGGYEALAADPAIDLVYVATEHSEHAADCLLALDHGKPVLCEKPFALDAEQAARVADAARRRGLFCMEALWTHFVPALRELDRRLQGGAIGDVRMLVAQLGSAVVFDRASRLFDPARGGGALLDLGVYPVSLAVAVLGAPTRVSAHAVLGPTGVDEQCTALLDFDGGRQAVITASLRHRLPNAADLTGTEGLVHVHEPLFCPEQLSVRRTPPAASAGGRRDRLTQALPPRVVRSVRAGLRYARTERIRRPVHADGYRYEVEEAVRCLRAGLLESPLLPLDHSLLVARTLDAIRDAFAERSPSPSP